MGQSPPKQQTPQKPAAPISENGADIAWVKEEEKRKQAARRGYAATLDPTRKASTVLAPGATALPKKTALG